MKNPERVERGRKNREQGEAFEFKVLSRLKRTCDFAIRSAGSKGIVDLVARTPNGVRYIVCKRNGYLPPTEREELKQFIDGLNPFEKVELFYYYNQRHFTFKILNSAEKVDECCNPIVFE
jgi:hypothetical protein